jgi:hypothetical protein
MTSPQMSREAYLSGLYETAVECEFSGSCRSLYQGPPWVGPSRPQQRSGPFSYLCTAQNCFRTRIGAGCAKEGAEARLHPVPFEDGRSVISRCAVDRGPSISVHQLGLDVATPVVTSWVSMEHWLRGSQVSKARPGAPVAFFRHGAFRRSCTG